MKTRNWFISVLVIASLACFTSCLNEGSSEQTYQLVPVYVSSNMGRVLLENNLGYPSPVYVPALDASMTVSPGDFLVSTFNINYDEQPAGAEYYTASLLSYIKAPTGRVQMIPGGMKDSYSDSIVNVTPYSTLLLHNKMFVTVEVKNSQTRVFDCELIINQDSTEKYGKPVGYLKSAIYSGGTDYNSPCRTFDMGQFINSSYARDSTIGEIKTKYADLKMYYQSGNTSDGDPVFKLCQDSVWRIYNVISQN